MVDRSTAATFAEHMREGAAAQRRGDLAAATRAVQAAHALVPGQPEAMRWLGEFARARGDEAAAESWWRASLAAHEPQPAVYNNLGNLLARSGRLEPALAALARATTLEPRYTDAHYNFARVLHRAGRHAEAGAALQRAMSLPGGPREAMLQLAARLHEAAGQFEPALQAIDAAIALAPGKPALHHNRGVLLHRTQRDDEALAAYERALALGAEGADVHYNHGNALQAVGRGADALAAYRRALAVEPRHRLALYDLARLRWRMGDGVGEGAGEGAVAGAGDGIGTPFDAELRALAAADPASSLAPGLRAHLLARADHHAEAEAAFAEAIAREPGAAGFHDGLGRALSRQGRHEAALAAHERAVALAPEAADFHAHHAAALLAAGRPAEAEAAAARACRIAPHDQHAWAQRALAWRLLGDARAARLEDVQRFVIVHDLPAPPGFADMASFNAALAEELGARHHDRREPVDQTLRGGTQTLGNLFDQRLPLVNALKARIAEAVTLTVAAWARAAADDEAQALQAQAQHRLPVAEHPLLARAAKAQAAGWQFTDSWSSRLARGGFHTNHVHPHGWVSSAYYVSVPPSVRASDSASHAGWIQIGQPDRELGLVPLQRVQPRPGRLVLFPSYLWHGTVPFEDDGASRLTVAFDVVPR